MSKLHPERGVVLPKLLAFKRPVRIVSNGRRTSIFDQTTGERIDNVLSVVWEDGTADHIFTWDLSR